MGSYPANRQMMGYQAMQANRHMRKLLGSVTVTAIFLTCQFGVGAQESDSGIREQVASEKMAVPPAGPAQVTPFHDSVYGHHQHYGDADAPTLGHPHYECPSQRNGIWYRPRSFGFGTKQHCRIESFNPRGFGNLFNPSVTCYRMDYHPYVLGNAQSDIELSYYRRRPQPCCKDGQCSLFGHKHEQLCDDCGMHQPLRRWSLLNFWKLH